MNPFGDFLDQAESNHRQRHLRGLTPISARECNVAGKKCLNFCSNNYLALADHPALKEGAIRWTEKYGAGSTASRLVTGTFEGYLELEEKIAAWKKAEAALVLGSGYLANLGLIPALTDRHTVILADKLNHASLNDGCRLAQARWRRYPHNRFFCPEQDRNQTRKLIVSDTVFSMDGDLADLQTLANFAKNEPGCLTYLDEAHATGIFGENGAGLAVSGEKLVIMGTFSKAMGSYGAYVACSRELREYLINRCASFIYSTAPPPSVFGAIAAALELVQTPEFSRIRRALHDQHQYLNRELRKLGFDTGNSASPIIPVLLGDNEKALRISQFLIENGILAVAIRPPTVPANSARLRFSVNAAHTANDLDLLVQTMKKARNLR